MKEKIIIWLISFLYRDEVGSKVGDFLEFYQYDKTARGPGRAFFGLMNQLIKSMPSLFANKFYWGANLLKNYLKITVRNIFRHKVFSGINILGFAISISLCLLVIQFIFSIHNQDAFNKNAEDIFRVTTIRKMEDGRATREATSPLPLADWLNNYQAIDNAVKINNRFKGLVKHKDDYLSFRGLYATPEFLECFTYKLDVGDIKNALSQPYSVILTRELAEKHFGEVNPIGRIFSVKDIGDFTVTGVMEELKGKKSHLTFEALASFSTISSLEARGIMDTERNYWKSFSDSYLYVMLKDGSVAADVEGEMNSLIRREYNEDDGILGFQLQNLMDISPGPSFANQPSTPIPPVLEYVLSAIALIILVIAVFNYNNLTIAKSLSRAREVGVRKAVGASRKNIFLQFVGEAVTTSLISLIIAYAVLKLLKAGLYDIHPRLFEIVEFSSDFDLQLLAAFGLFAIAAGVFSGLFPAIYISRFKPVDSLKEISNLTIRSKFSFKKALIVSQFFISILFVVFIIVGIKQVNYLREVDYGFGTENVVNLNLKGNNYKVLKNELLAESRIESITCADYMPGMGILAYDFVYQETLEEPRLVSFISVGSNFLTHMNIDLLCGENFPQEAEEGNERYLLINEKAVASLGYESPEAAIGKSMSFKNGGSLKTIGVVRDFIVQNYDNPIEPLLIRVSPNSFRTMSIKYIGDDREDIKRLIEEHWSGIDKVNSLEMSFYDDDIEESFAGPELLLKACGFIAFLALIIACFGLLGMVLYEMESKVKDIGIRKVLGAKVSGLVLKQSKGFLRLLVVASIFALPVSYLLSSLFLENMVFRADIGFEPYLLGVSVILIAGILIIFSQTIRAALSNPIDALRDE